MNIELSNAESDELNRDWQPSAKARRQSLEKSKLDTFARSQRAKLLDLRQRLVESIGEIGAHARVRSCDNPALQTHQADAATEVNDRDLALGLLSHEHDALFEIDQALVRIESGAYGICEISGKQIPRDRLEAIPFARFTVECQSQLEEENKVSRLRRSASRLLSMAVSDPDDQGEELSAPTEEDRSAIEGARMGRRRW